MNRNLRPRWQGFFVPALAIAVLACGRADLSSAADRNIASGPSQAAVDSVHHIFTAQYSGLSAPVRLAVRDSATWNNLWGQVQAVMVPAPPSPSIDFSREMVVIAGLGERGTGGYAIVVDSVNVTRPDLTVYVTVTAPGVGCVLTQAVTQPVDIVRVPRVEGAVLFQEVSKKHACT